MIYKIKPYYIYGLHSTIAALNNKNRVILKILCSQKIYLEYQKIISNHPYKITQNSELSKILPHNSLHQEIAVLTMPISSFNFENINFNSNIVICDQINDPHNIGAIIRSAAAFNIGTVILTINHCPNENSTIAKVASGGLEFIKFIVVNNISNTIDKLKKIGFWVIGLDSNSPNSLKNFNKKILQDKVVLILGAENKGLRQLTKQKCDLLIKIPIYNIDSLNVSATSAIIFSEIANIYIK